MSSSQPVDRAAAGFEYAILYLTAVPGSDRVLDWSATFHRAGRPPVAAPLSEDMPNGVHIAVLEPLDWAGAQGWRLLEESVQALPNPLWRRYLMERPLHPNT